MKRTLPPELLKVLADAGAEAAFNKPPSDDTRTDAYMCVDPTRNVWGADECRRQAFTKAVIEKRDELNPDASPAPGWVSVGERLPVEADGFQSGSEKGFVMIWIPNVGLGWHTWRRLPSCVTHWFRIPEISPPTPDPEPTPRELALREFEKYAKPLGLSETAYDAAKTIWLAAKGITD